MSHRLQNPFLVRPAPRAVEPGAADPSLPVSTAMAGGPVGGLGLAPAEAERVRAFAQLEEAVTARAHRLGLAPAEFARRLTGEIEDGSSPVLAGEASGDRLRLREARHRFRNHLQLLASAMRIEARERLAARRRGCEVPERPEGNLRGGPVFAPKAFPGPAPGPRGEPDGLPEDCARCVRRTAALADLDDLVEQADAAPGAAVDLGAALRRLADDLIEAGGFGRPVAVHVAACRLPLPSAEARAAVLIANECLHNVLKHAFPDGEGPADGTVSLRLRRDGRDAVLEVEDNGRGSSAPRRRRAEGGEGAGLMAALAGELHASVEHPPVPRGLLVRVRFPLPREAFA